MYRGTISDTHPKLEELSARGKVLRKNSLLNALERRGLKKKLAYNRWASRTGLGVGRQFFNKAQAQVGRTRGANHFTKQILQAH